MYALRPGQHGADVNLTQPSPEEIHRWLGGRFAMLEAPHHRARTIGQSWESVDDQGGVRNAEVRLSHELDDDTTIDLITARDDTDGTSIGNRLRLCLSNYHLGLLGRRSTFPWGAGPPPPDYFERLEADLPGEPSGTRVIPIDGRGASWIYLTFPDLINGTQLIACGTRIGTSLIMITGTETAVADARVYLWPRPAPLASEK